MLGAGDGCRWNSQHNLAWLAVTDDGIGMPDEQRTRTSTDLSAAMSKDMLRRGFKFVGATIMYAFMQAAGLTNDHVTTCFKYGK